MEFVLKNKIKNSDISCLKSIGTNNVIIDCVFVGENIVIDNNCTLRNCIIKEGTYITDSYLDDCVVGKDTKIGPFSRIRPFTQIGDNCKIGNFVEIKNSKIGSGTKVSHLAYIGDAIVGNNVNIGCGVVVCNYDGVDKNVTLIGDNSFVGSNVNLIAPLKIANDSYICAGSTVTKNTSNGDFVIGRVKSQSNPNHLYYLKNKIKK